MCLIINKIKKDTQVTSTIAEEDIKVFKVYRHLEGSDVLVSPYRLAITERGEQPEVKMRIVQRTYLTHAAVEEGYHSFKNLGDARLLIRHISFPHRFSVFKCVIPKGSHYYEGVFDILNNDLECYASNNLIVLEEKTKAR